MIRISGRQSAAIGALTSHVHFHCSPSGSVVVETVDRAPVPGLIGLVPCGAAGRTRKTIDADLLEPRMAGVEIEGHVVGAVEVPARQARVVDVIGAGGVLRMRAV